MKTATIAGIASATAVDPYVESTDMSWMWVIFRPENPLRRSAQ